MKRKYEALLAGATALTALGGGALPIAGAQDVEKKDLDYYINNPTTVCKNFTTGDNTIDIQDYYYARTALECHTKTDATPESGEYTDWMQDGIYLPL